MMKVYTYFVFLLSCLLTLVGAQTLTRTTTLTTTSTLLSTSTTTVGVVTSRTTISRDVVITIYSTTTETSTTRFPSTVIITSSFTTSVTSTASVTETRTQTRIVSTTTTQLSSTTITLPASTQTTSVPITVTSVVSTTSTRPGLTVTTTLSAVTVTYTQSASTSIVTTTITSTTTSSVTRLITQSTTYTTSYPVSTYITTRETSTATTIQIVTSTTPVTRTSYSTSFTTIVSFSTITISTTLTNSRTSYITTSYPVTYTTYSIIPTTTVSFATITSLSRISTTQTASTTSTYYITLVSTTTTPTSITVFVASPTTLTSVVTSTFPVTRTSLTSFSTTILTTITSVSTSLLTNSIYTTVFYFETRTRVTVTTTPTTIVSFSTVTTSTTTTSIPNPVTSLSLRTSYVTSSITSTAYITSLTTDTSYITSRTTSTSYITSISTSYVTIPTTYTSLQTLTSTTSYVNSFTQTVITSAIATTTFTFTPSIASCTPVTITITANSTSTSSTSGTVASASSAASGCFVAVDYDDGSGTLQPITTYFADQQQCKTLCGADNNCLSYTLDEPNYTVCSLWGVNSSSFVAGIEGRAFALSCPIMSLGQAASSSTTTTATPSPTSSATICGSTFAASGPQVTQLSQFITDASTCQTYCAGQSQCQAYSFDIDNPSVCTLYSSRAEDFVAGNEIIVYAAGCPASTLPSSSSSSSSSINAQVTPPPPADNPPDTGDVTDGNFEDDASVWNIYLQRGNIIVPNGDAVSGGSISIDGQSGNSFFRAFTNSNSSAPRRKVKRGGTGDMVVVSQTPSGLSASQSSYDISFTFFFVGDVLGTFIELKMGNTTVISVTPQAYSPGVWHSISTSWINTYSTSNVVLYVICSTDPTSGPQQYFVDNVAVWDSGTNPATANNTTPLTCPGLDGQVYNSLGSVLYNQRCQVDYYNYDLSVQTTQSFQACMDACTTTDSCVAVGWYAYSGRCYLKYAVSSSRTHYADQVQAAVRQDYAIIQDGSATTLPASSLTVTSSSTTTTTTTTRTPTPTANLTCPGIDGSVYSIGNLSYYLRCDTDFYGGDIGSQYPIYTFNACLALCATNSGCVGVGWYSPTTGNGWGTCLFKGFVGTGSRHSSGGVWTGIRADYTITNTGYNGYLPYSTLSNGATTCPALDGQTYISPNAPSKYFIQRCYEDIYLGDLGPVTTSISTFQKCIDLCATTTRCVAASWNRPYNYCYLKGSYSTSSIHYNADLVSAVLAGYSPINDGPATFNPLPAINATVPAAITPDPSFNYSALDSTLLQLPNATPMFLRYAVDFFNGDIRILSRIPSAYECATQCVGTPTCRAFGWYFTTGTCFLKSGVTTSSIHYNPNTIAGIMITYDPAQDYSPSFSYPPDPPTTCPALNNKSYRPPRQFVSSRVFDVKCGEGWRTGSYDPNSNTFADCMNNCSNSQCVAVTFNSVSGTCFLHYSVNRSLRYVDSNAMFAIRYTYDS